MPVNIEPDNTIKVIPTEKLLGMTQREFEKMGGTGCGISTSCMISRLLGLPSEIWKMRTIGELDKLCGGRISRAHCYHIANEIYRLGNKKFDDLIIREE